MEKGKRIEVEFLLPEAIIQHIQSFLNGKQAAQTKILSKSWYSAWSTRPDLDFDQRDFGSNFHNRGDEKGFWEFTTKTMKRYEELNLKIESFRLWMKASGFDNVVHYSYSLASELIVKAMKMGATDLNFELHFGNKVFALPHEVLGSETLIRLSVTGCKIDLGADEKVSCSRLQSLSLCRVYMKGDIIWDIISSCPLIEKLSLSGCRFLFESRSSNIVSSTSLLALSPFIEFGKHNVGSVVDGPINPYEFCKLKCLLLVEVDIHTLFFSDFSSKFPCLKDLTINYCSGYNYKGIKISSHSLERISFAQKRMLRANFDVPSIRKFSFSGSSLPCLTFQTASREWVSDISIICSRPSTSWFLKLKKLLTNLSLSKISLSLIIRFIVEKSIDFQGLPKPVVENLTMHAPSSVCSALLECLFRSCRPKFITHYWFPKSCTGGNANDFLEILCKRLVQGVSENCSISDQNKFGLHDLEEVNVELFEESLAEWRPLPWKTLLDASASPENQQKIRFQLRWREEPSTFK